MDENIKKDWNERHNPADNKQQIAVKTSSGPPVFNKRLFATQGAVIITQEARRIMRRNALCIQSGIEHKLSKAELLSMRAVVGGLNLIHKTHDHIKNVLSHVVTLETYEQYEYIEKKDWEENLSCYYIVHGAAEVTYDVGSSEARNVYQPNIVYNHGTGEYLGMVSTEGPDEDISPPATVYTKEMSELLRIDRTYFHSIVSNTKSILRKEIESYLLHGDSVLTELSVQAKSKLLNLIEKQEYPPNDVILKQGEIANYLYVLKSGRCECLREVCIVEADKTAKLYLNCREKDDFFGEECILDKEPSYVQILTTSATVCYKVPKVAFEILKRENLTSTISKHRHEFPVESNLQDRAYSTTLWNNYKFSKIRDPLVENGKTQLMWKTQKCRIAVRPPSENKFSDVIPGDQLTSYVRASAKYVRRYLAHGDNWSPSNKGIHIKGKQQMALTTHWILLDSLNCKNCQLERATNRYKSYFIN